MPSDVIARGVRHARGDIYCGEAGQLLRGIFPDRVSTKDKAISGVSAMPAYEAESTVSLIKPLRNVV